LVVADIGAAVGVIGRIASRRHTRRTISHVEAGKELASLYRYTLIAVALISLAHSAKAESGYASYYGGRGHKGEMTCAHRTRPFGSVVTVTYAGHSIHCRINDRGPFVRGRVIDVSLSAARALGMMRSGVVAVLVE
jgi:rare lipoprotein A